MHAQLTSQLKALCSAAAAISLLGCGGGGGSSTQVPPPGATQPQRSPKLLWQNYLQLSYEYRLAESGTPSGSVTFRFEPAVSDTVPISATPATRSRRHLTTELNPNLNLGPSYQGYLDIFSEPDGLVTGRRLTIGQGSSVYCFSVASSAIPSQDASVGASGPIASFMQKLECTSTSIDLGYRTELTWALRSDNTIPNIVFFCVRETLADQPSAPDFQELCIDAKEDNTLGTIGRFTFDGGYFYRTK